MSIARPSFKDRHRFLSSTCMLVDGLEAVLAYAKSRTIIAVEKFRQPFDLDATEIAAISGHRDLTAI
jgi:hypothetical protein